MKKIILALLVIVFLIFGVSYCNNQSLDFDSSNITRIELFYLSSEDIVNRELDDHEVKQVIDIMENVKAKKISSHNEKGGWDLKLTFYNDDHKLYSLTQGDYVFIYNAQYYSIDEKSELKFIEFKVSLNES